jgi:hypothetical protein
VKIRDLLAAASMFVVPTLANAAPTAPLPEPETLALIGVGAIALVVARWHRRK